MTLHEMIRQIDNDFTGIHFAYIYGASCVGDPLSNAMFHPIRYVAYATTRAGDDDPFEGVGWTATEAVRDLLKTLKEELG